MPPYSLPGTPSNGDLLQQTLTLLTTLAEASFRRHRWALEEWATIFKRPQGRVANQVSLSKHRRRSSEKEDKNNRSIKQSVTTDRSLTLLELAEAHKSHSVSSVLFTT